MSHKRTLTESERQLIAEMYQSGSSMQSIARQLKCNDRLIKDYIHESGIAKESKKQENPITSFFPDPEDLERFKEMYLQQSVYSLKEISDRFGLSEYEIKKVAGELELERFDFGAFVKKMKEEERKEKPIIGKKFLKDYNNYYSKNPKDKHKSKHKYDICNMSMEELKLFGTQLKYQAGLK